MVECKHIEYCLRYDKNSLVCSQDLGRGGIVREGIRTPQEVCYEMMERKLADKKK